jgi:alpha-beta hydrolase superfamily lysophospholipase
MSDTFTSRHPDAGDVSSPDTILLIHGLWMTPRSWERWIERYDGRGFTVVAPSWPGLEADVEALRRDPSPLADQSAAKILAHYEEIIRGLDSPPIIMGHSFGGTFTQILVDRGLGAAGVSIHGATVRGIRDLPLSTLRSTAHVLSNPSNRGKAVPIDDEHFRYAFGNTLDADASRAAWERYAVPAAARVLFEGATANLNPKTAFRVDWSKRDRAPMLFIGGGADHVVPAKVSRKIAAKAGRSGAVTAFEEFPRRSHFTAGEPGWEEVADLALRWATEHAGRKQAVNA